MRDAVSAKSGPGDKRVASGATKAMGILGLLCPLQQVVPGRNPRQRLRSVNAVCVYVRAACHSDEHDMGCTRSGRKHDLRLCKQLHTTQPYGKR